MSHSNCALVLEGGGYRGVFTAGVLDVFMEHGVNNFSDIWGTSAGALNGANFKSGQLGRQMRLTLAFRDDSRMMSFYSFVTKGSIMDKEFLYDTVQNQLDPFDNEAFNENPTRLWACATSVMFGTPVYNLVDELPRDLPAIIASASLPVFSESVQYKSELLIDGGTADSVPVEVALGQMDAQIPDDPSYTPANKAIVVLTQPRDYVKEPKSPASMKAYQAKYGDYPYFVEGVETRYLRYNAQRQRIFDLERQGKVIVIAPEKSLDLEVTEENGEKLLAAYLQGRNAALACLDKIKDFVVQEAL